MGTIKGAFRNIAVATALAMLLTSGIKTFAVEGLKISVQSGTNVVLYWPSTDSEYYLIQYRPSLDPSTPWQTLGDYYYGASGTNITSFVHTDIVRYPALASGSGTNTPNISPMSMSTMSSSTDSSSLSDSSAPMPMVVNAAGNAVPLALYPSGFYLSGLTIFDPVTGESVSGDGYLISEPVSSSLKSSSLTSSQINQFQPMGANDASGITNQYTGFYQVVRDGAHLFGLTNGAVLSGTVHLPVELANSDGTVSALSLTENDAPIGNSVQSAPVNLPLALVVDTTLMSNGVHMVSASARWDDTNGNVWEADSPPISVTVSNEISFPNWMPQFGETGNSLLIRATSAHTNTDWFIDVYDSSNIYIGTFGGHTDDGDIYVVWDLIGPDSVAHTNDNFFNFYITTEYIDPPMPPTYRQADPWLGKGAWCEVLQHAFDYLTDSQTLYEELNGFVSAPGAMGANLFPPASADGSPYTLNFGSDNPQGNIDWANFRTALYHPLTHNLVYFGHGGPTGLGQNISNTNRFISATEIANRLHTIPEGQTNRHNFRFVFVDACSTGKGSLCKAFGIRDTENVPDIDYINASMRHSCYVGWPNDKAIGFAFGNTVNYDHVAFIQHIQTQLFFGDTIRAAVDTASRQPDVGIFLNNNLKIYGSWNVTLGSDNR